MNYDTLVELTREERREMKLAGLRRDSRYGWNHSGYIGKLEDGTFICQVSGKKERKYNSLAEAIARLINVNRLNPNRKLPKALQWIDESGKLRDKVADDLGLIGMVFCLPPFGDRLHIPADILRDGDRNKSGIPINDLIKRRRKLGMKDQATIDAEIEAEEREKRIQAFIDNGMGVDAEDGGMKDFYGEQYNHGDTHVHLKGLASMSGRYGQVFTMGK